MWVLRKILSPMGTTDAMEFLLEKLKSSKNNNDFFDAKTIRLVNLYLGVEASQ